MIDAILLAAGSSRRFGSPKLLAHLDGSPIVCHTLNACIGSRLDRIYVIVAAEKRLEQAINTCGSAGGRVALIRVDRPDAGMMASIQTGMRAIESAHSPSGSAPHGAMIVLADMPFVTSSMINTLIDRYDPKRGVVIPECDGVTRHPRIIPHDLFAEFLALGDNDRGWRVLERHPDRMQRVDVGTRTQYRDIDTTDDLDSGKP